jgi:hypothetical protein
VPVKLPRSTEQTRSVLRKKLVFVLPENLYMYMYSHTVKPVNSTCSWDRRKSSAVCRDVLFSRTLSLWNANPVPNAICCYSQVWCYLEVCYSQVSL